MHRILVRPPPPFALGAAAVAGGKAEVLLRQGVTLLLALAAVGVIEREHARNGSVADRRPRERSPRVGAAVHLSSGSADDRGSSGVGA